MDTIYMYMILDDNKCINKQLKPSKMSLKSNDESLAADVKGLLALVCVCLSILSLLVTVLIYSYFTELQSWRKRSHFVHLFTIYICQTSFP